MKTLKNKTLRVFLLIMMMLLVVPVAVSAAPKLNKTSISINVKKTYSLKVSGTKKKITWKSANKNVATVSSKGVVTGKSAGKTTISAKVAGKTLKCTVTVKKLSSGGSSSPSGDVWLSATGTKYHRINNCGRMDPRKARKVSLSYAISHGFEKCKVCF